MQLQQLRHTLKVNCEFAHYEQEGLNNLFVPSTCPKPEADYFTEAYGDSTGGLQQLRKCSDKYSSDGTFISSTCPKAEAAYFKKTGSYHHGTHTLQQLKYQYLYGAGDRTVGEAEEARRNELGFGYGFQQLASNAQASFVMLL